MRSSESLSCRVVREGHVHPLMRQTGGIRARSPQGSVIRQQRHPLMRLPMPAALVVAGQKGEPETAPPVRKIAPHPSCLDAESDIAVPGLRQEKPLDPTFDVPFECVVTKPEHLGVVTY